MSSDGKRWGRIPFAPFSNHLSQIRPGQDVPLPTGLYHVMLRGRKYAEKVDSAFRGAFPAFLPRIAGKKRNRSEVIPRAGHSFAQLEGVFDRTTLVGPQMPD